MIKTCGNCLHFEAHFSRLQDTGRGVCLLMLPTTVDIVRTKGDVVFPWRTDYRACKLWRTGECK